MDLSPALARLVPELHDVDLHEPLATCSRCVMAPRPHDEEGRIRFTAAARCCTYHPDLPNFLVGAALRDGGPGAEAIRRRLKDPDGVTPLGIAPTKAAAKRYAARSPTDFGRDASLTCPYWVPGDLGCSIHAHRNAICRTWSCRATHGGRSVAASSAVKHLVRDLERRVAETVRREVDGDWPAYFIACSERADALEPAALHGPRLQALLKTVRETIARRDRPLPLRPTPSLRGWSVDADHAELQAWSPYDPIWAPTWIFELLGRLDGRTPWPDAVAATEAAVGQRIPPDLVARLWWRGALAEPVDDEGDAIDIVPSE